MNERILEAISKLKKAQDELEVKLKSMEQNIDEKGSLNMQKALFTVADDLARYTIKDGNWYYNGKDTGIQAEAHDGKDGARGPQGLPGKEGRPGRDGKDGVTPELKIGKIEVSPEYGGAMAKLRPGKDNIMYLDLTLPRGPQGFTGFDGKDAKINGVNTLSIEAGTNISIDQQGNTLTINSTGGGGGGTSNYNALTNKPKINNVELNGNKTSSDLGLQPAGNYLTSETDPVFTASASAGITSSDITNWNSKGTYSKPSGGIPKTDLASAVQTSLNKADTALQSHQDISGKLDISKFYNDYYFGMPKTIYAKLNTEMKFYYNNITTANYLLKWGQYTNSTTIRDNDDYISVLPTAKATKNITYQVYDRFLNSIESGTTSFVINDTEPSSQTMLIIGDSFVSFNYIGPDLRDLFTNDGNTLTLIGTQGSDLNKHEGYAGWKYTDFTTNSKASSNPFWDGSKFNFTYYMNQNGYSNLDSVYIQLGTNDASAGSANQNMTDVINAAQTMINSILEYNSNIKIYLGLTVMPTLKTSKFAEKYNGIGLNWIMRANMQKLNKALIDTFSNNSSIKIVANNLILDSTTDISDNVHPTRTGFTKIANQVYYTMMN